MNCHPDTSETDMEVLALVIDSSFMCYAGACTCPLKRYLPARDYLERYTGVAPHTPQSLQLGIQIERELGNDNAVETYSQILKSKFPRSNESRQFMEGEENGQFAY